MTRVEETKHNIQDTLNQIHEIEEKYLDNDIDDATRGNLVANMIGSEALIEIAISLAMIVDMIKEEVE